MAKDQKPVGMRVVGSTAGLSQPRPGELPDAGIAGPGADMPRAGVLASGLAAAAGPAPKLAQPTARTLLPALVFLIGCALGGVALVLMGFA